MIREYLLSIPSRRAPDVIIKRPEGDYLHRWYVIPRNPLFNIYLHRFLASDMAIGLHDHPWLFNASWILEGGYMELVFSKAFAKAFERYYRRAGDWKWRWGGSPHRIELHRDYSRGLRNARYVPATTLFITGPRVRVWGFFCLKGWRPFYEVTRKAEDGVVTPIEGACE